MKKLLSLILALCVLMALCACTTDNGNETTEPSTTTAPSETTEQTKPTEEPTEAEKPSYTVKVVDSEGNPIVGAVVQLCLDACVPAVTDADGVAAFFLPEADYKVSLPAMPEGYTYTTEEQEFHFAKGSNELTITLKTAA